MSKTRAEEQIRYGYIKRPLRQANFLIQQKKWYGWKTSVITRRESVMLYWVERLREVGWLPKRFDNARIFRVKTQAGADCGIG